MNHHHHHTESPLTFHEKAIKLIEHWINHNDDHVKTYLDWAEKLKNEGYEQAALYLEKAVEDTKKINEVFVQVKNNINK